jgi:hypothetical protein
MTADDHEMGGPAFSALIAWACTAPEDASTATGRPR